MKAFIWIMVVFIICLWGFQEIKKQWDIRHSESTIADTFTLQSHPKDDIILLTIGDTKPKIEFK